MKGKKEDKIFIQSLIEALIAVVIALNICIRLDWSNFSYNILNKISSLPFIKKLCFYPEQTQK